MSAPFTPGGTQQPVQPEKTTKNCISALVSVVALFSVADLHAQIQNSYWNPTGGSGSIDWFFRNGNWQGNTPTADNPRHAFISNGYLNINIANQQGFNPPPHQSRGIQLHHGLPQRLR